MAALNAELRSDAGVVADIGSIEVGEVTGGVNLAGARLGRAHLELRVPAAEIMRRLRLASPEIAGVYLDDKTLVEQFRQGGPEVRLPDEVAKSAEADFRVDSVQLLTPRDGGPVLRIPMAAAAWTSSRSRPARSPEASIRRAAP